MHATIQTTEKASPIRRTYAPLGTDTNGASHVYRTVDETIFVIHDGRITHRIDVNGRLVDDYMTHVQDVRGWRDRRYGFDLVDQLADTIEGPR
jgi:hypothetical protein